MIFKFIQCFADLQSFCRELHDPIFNLLDLILTCMRDNYSDDLIQIFTYIYNTLRNLSLTFEKAFEKARNSLKPNRAERKANIQISFTYEIKKRLKFGLYVDFQEYAKSFSS
ncbi:hypothetical protein BpHYR1_038301 [Brachionus plicatilis]|uniref:Uncharacterized protein n=1 Tax=Brachionus plicatilis TaxID=10195 RepID=A0A3M7SHV2_BRAPC|nr:hypothetical protein BpHYR1_038301 [Brachionus plicatilis]